MSNLRNKLIRLAHSNPELRKDLLPLLTEKKASSFDAIYDKYNKKDFWGVKKTIADRIKAFPDMDPKVIEDHFEKDNKTTVKKYIWDVIEKAHKSGDSKTLIERVRYDQVVSRDFYEAISGKNLPKSNKELKEFFHSEYSK